MKPTSYIADFDSAAAMLRTLANFLHGQDFPLLGALPRWMAPEMKVIAAMVNRMPKNMKEQVYIWSGWFEAVAARNLHKAKTDRIADWTVGLYPKRRYPAVAVGSSNGALTHLWSALGIPWLPQTFLIPVARSGPHPDEPMEDVKWAEKWATVFLKANPDVQLCHLHDPNQDRLMIQRMAYFRVKKLRLGAAYEQFLQHYLEPGGTIFIVDCGLTWPRRSSASGISFSLAPSAAPHPRSTITEANGWRSIFCDIIHLEHDGKRRHQTITARIDRDKGVHL